MANYRVSGFLSIERKLCSDDNVFFTLLLTSSSELLGKAYNKGKIIAHYTEPFLDAYKIIVNDDLAYHVFVHQDDFSHIADALIKDMDTVDTRFTNAFMKYWAAKCLKSVKNLYYRILIIDPSAPKFDGLGPEPSRIMYKKLLSFKASVDNDLCKYIEEKPSDDSAAETEFLQFVYENIVSKEYPNSAGLLCELRNRIDSDASFYEELLEMNIPKARIELGIGEVLAKEVNKMCEMLRKIVHHPGTKKVYEESNKATLFFPRIEKQMAKEHIRTYHSYQKFMDSCNGSVSEFYMRVVGMSGKDVKFPGLNWFKSQDLYNYFLNTLPQIDSFLDDEDISPTFLRNTLLHNLNLTEIQSDNIINIAKNCGHFPLFTAISYLMTKMGDREYEIARRGLNIVYGQKIQDLNEISSSLNLSRERVRQLRANCLGKLLSFPKTLSRIGLIDEYEYDVQSDYDIQRIREEECVDFSNDFITICISIANPNLSIIGSSNKTLLKSSDSTSRLYLVPTDIHKLFDFNLFIIKIENMLKEKRFYPYRDDLESFIRVLIKKEIPDEEFYRIVKECRQILLKGYPNNIINSQLFFPANARKTIPYLIEDILREFNHPMTAEQICSVLNERYPDLEQIPSKIGANALRNSNIVAVSRSSTYTLTEWSYSEKRGGTIRDIVEEYLNSLIEPIASLTDICDQVAIYRKNVKESSIKTNLLAETSNKFSLYYKNGEMFIGFSNYTFDPLFEKQEKRHGRRSFQESITLLEQFIQENRRFPYSSGVSDEEIRLNRFLGACKYKQQKGLLAAEEQVAIDHLEEKYAHYKGNKERAPQEDLDQWMSQLERYVSFITINESLPLDKSKEALWYSENRVLYDKGRLSLDKRSAFSTLIKIVSRMKRAEVDNALNSSNLPGIDRIMNWARLQEWWNPWLVNFESHAESTMQSFLDNLKNPSNLIESAFSWGLTEEGSQYWRNANISLKEYVRADLQGFLTTIKSSVEKDGVYTIDKECFFKESGYGPAICCEDIALEDLCSNVGLYLQESPNGSYRFSLLGN